MEGDRDSCAHAQIYTKQQTKIEGLSAFSPHSCIPYIRSLGWYEKTGVAHLFTGFLSQTCHQAVFSKLICAHCTIHEFKKVHFSFTLSVPVLASEMPGAVSVTPSATFRPRASREARSNACWMSLSKSTSIVPLP